MTGATTTGHIVQLALEGVKASGVHVFPGCRWMTLLVHTWVAGLPFEDVCELRMSGWFDTNTCGASKVHDVHIQQKCKSAHSTKCHESCEGAFCLVVWSCKGCGSSGKHG